MHLSTHIFRHEEPERLEDIIGQQRDLYTAREFARRGMEMTSQDSLVIHEALWVAAISRYSRCFSSGVRHQGITKKDIPGELLELHNEIWDTRQKFLGHSVNDWETNCVTVVLAKSEFGAIHGVQSIGCLDEGLILYPNHFGAIDQLTTALLKFAEKVIDEEKFRLLKIAKELDPEELAKSPVPGKKWIDLSSISKNRKKTEHKARQPKRTR